MIVTGFLPLKLGIWRRTTLHTEARRTTWVSLVTIRRWCGHRRMKSVVDLPSVVGDHQARSTTITTFAIIVLCKLHVNKILLFLLLPLAGIIIAVGDFVFIILL